MFTVVYNAYEGETEVFGMFADYDEALDWMKKDIDESIDTLKRLGYLKQNYEADMSRESYVEIENQGTWQIVDVTEVSVIR